MAKESHSSSWELRIIHRLPLTHSLPLNVPCVPMNPARKPMDHNIIAKGHANDDEVSPGCLYRIP